MDSTDNETGEMLPKIQFPEIEMCEFDMETGEPDANAAALPMRKTKFIIPKELIRPAIDQKSKCCCIDPNDNFTLFKKEEVIGLQEEIILGYNKTSHRLFLIPSLFICFRLCAPLMAVIEICLHIWAHKKNSKNTNAHIYYRSPLHIMTAQFCAVCRNQSVMDQVSKLQAKRQKSWRLHFKDVAKTMY